MSDDAPTGFCLLTEHRLKVLEATVREDHTATEQLRIDLATFQARTETKAKAYAAVISLVISLVGALSRYL